MYELGNWVNVPDGQVTYITRDAGFYTDYFWVMPDGSTLKLLPGDFQGSSHWFDYGLSGVSIRVTRDTLPGFLAYGLIGSDEPGVGDILAQPPRADPGVLGTISGEVLGRDSSGAPTVNPTNAISGAFSGVVSSIGSVATIALVAGVVYLVFKFKPGGK